METKTSVNSKGKQKAAGGEERDEGKPTGIADVDISKGNVKGDGPKDEKKGDVGQDTRKPGGAVNSTDNVPPAVTTTKPIVDNVKVTPLAVDAAPGLGSSTPTTTADKKDNTKKEESHPIVKDEKAGPAFDGKPTKPSEGVESSKQKVEPLIADEGDVATPKRVTKELPASPAESLKEKLVPTLGLTVPEPPKDGSAPLSTATVTGSVLSPLQKVLENTEDETLMDRMARLKLWDASYQPPKDAVPPAHTDLESEFVGETAPSTPKSKTRRESFSFLLHSDVPLSDDDDFFLDCDSNTSVSNFDGV